jgi:glycosyltransferase involved in cell wall biosynthesis
MRYPTLDSTVTIGILAKEFLVNIGANDLLKNLIRGLDLIQGLEIIFICPIQSGIAIDSQLPGNESFTHELKAKYHFYGVASNRMRFVMSESDGQSLLDLQVHQGIDLFFPSIFPLPGTLKYITYWPDCQPKYYPQFFDDESQAVRDNMISSLVNCGMPMIINSEAAKNDIIRFYGANSAQIHSLPFAPIIEFMSLAPYPELLTDYCLPPKYFLVSNQFWIHKSIETVLEAVRFGLDRGHSFHVVFTGKMEEPRRPEYIDWIRSLVDKLEISSNITFLDYIPKSHQIEIMKWSEAVIQPTLFEGGPGGGSVYDAISIGSRAIVTELPVNKEIRRSGNQVFYFAPRDPQSLYMRMVDVSEAEWIFPSFEDLYQQSQESCLMLADSLYIAIQAALNS